MGSNVAVPHIPISLYLQIIFLFLLSNCLFRFHLFTFHLTKETVSTFSPPVENQLEKYKKKEREETFVFSSFS